MLYHKTIFLFLLMKCITSVAQNNVRQGVYYPGAIAIDSKGNLFVSCNSQMPDIVKITSSGEATEFVSISMYRKKPSERWANMDLFTPGGLAFDAEDTLYVIDKGAASILKISPEGHVKIVAGNKGHVLKDGSVSVAAFQKPTFIAIDKMKNIYVSDEGGEERNNTEYGVIRKISPQGDVTTLKDKNGVEFHFDAAGMTCDADGNIFVCDRTGRCIKKISPNGNVSILAGQCGKRKYNPVYKEGDVQTAEFMEPWYIALAKNGEIFFSDIRVNRIIKIANNKVSTVAGNSKIDLEHSNIQGYSEAGYLDGPAKKALFNQPLGISFDKNGNLFIADGINHCIRKLSPDGMVSTFYK